MKRNRLPAVTGVAAAIVVGLVLAGCMFFTRPPIERITWYVSSWSEQATLPTDVSLSLYFDGDGYAGSTGVNDFTGKLDRNGHTLKLGEPHLTTRETGTWTQQTAERAFLTALPQITRWDVQGSSLTLTGGDREFVLVTR